MKRYSELFCSLGVIFIGTLGMAVSLQSNNEASGLLAVLSGAVLGFGLGWYFYRCRGM